MDPSLHRAAMEGQVELLRSIVEAKSPSVLLSRPPRNNTVLHIASRLGNEDFAAEVLRLCPSLLCEPDSRLDTPLHVAARSDRTHIVRLLISRMQSSVPAEEEGTSRGWRMKNRSENIPLHEAIKRGHEEIGLQLLDVDEETAMIGNGAGESPLYLAAKSGLRTLVLRILKCPRFSSEGPNGRSPLHSAVINRNLGISEMLTQSLPHLAKQTDMFGKTAIHYAAAEAAMKIPPPRIKTVEKTIHLLLSADPSSAAIPDEHGVSPPLLAAAKGNIRLLKTLLSYSPDCYYLLNSEGQNAIHLAVLHNKTKMLKYLIERPEFEGLANEVDDGGNTYLHFAAAKCNPGIVRLLLECQGVDLNITNKDGYTCLDALPSRKGLRLRIVKSMIENRARANLKGRPFRGMTRGVTREMKPEIVLF